MTTVAVPHTHPAFKVTTVAVPHTHPALCVLAADKMLAMGSNPMTEAVVPGPEHDIT